MQSRQDVVTPGVVSYYHCISRCVRRAFLCGTDAYSGKCYSHRRSWILDRLTHLLSAFSVELVAYAAMGNHLHSVIKVRPDLAQGWSDEKVARHWILIFPKKLRHGDEERHLQEQIQAIAMNPALVTKYRQRLSDVSWFNRCLNEHIARKANREDDVKGRFWEGRFKCQLLQDENAVLACMVYVDLNPFRAGIAKTPEASEFTSIQARQKENAQSSTIASPIPPLKSINSIFGSRVSLTQYMCIVDDTARVHVEGKSALSAVAASILTRLGIADHQWVPTTMRHFKNRFRRVVGTPEQLRKHARDKGRSWFQGIAGARALFGTA